MRYSKPFPPTASALLALAVLLVASRSLPAQPCAPPGVFLGTNCPGGELQVLFTASDFYDGASLRVLESPGGALVDELIWGPLGPGEEFVLVALLPNGDYSVEGVAICPGGSPVTTIAPVTIACSPLTLATQLAQPYPSQISAASLSISQQGVRTSSLLQTWSGPAFDPNAFTPATVAGSANYIGQQGYDLSMDLVVASVGANSAVLDCLVVSISPDLLALILSLGGTDPSGATIGSITVSTGAPLGSPTIDIDFPDPFPPSSTWVPVDVMQVAIEIDTPFVVLPVGPSVVTVESEVTAHSGGAPPSRRAFPSTRCRSCTSPFSRRSSAPSRPEPRRSSPRRSPTRRESASRSTRRASSTAGRSSSPASRGAPPPASGGSTSPGCRARSPDRSSSRPPAPRRWRRSSGSTPPCRS